MTTTVERFKNTWDVKQTSFSDLYSIAEVFATGVAPSFTSEGCGDEDLRQEHAEAFPEGQNTQIWSGIPAPFQEDTDLGQGSRGSMTPKCPGTVQEAYPMRSVPCQMTGTTFQQRVPCCLPLFRPQSRGLDC